jgi:hypothetical protein
MRLAARILVWVIIPAGLGLSFFRPDYLKRSAGIRRRYPDI